MKETNWQEEDKEITEILLELSEQENKQLRYENHVLRNLLKQQEANIQGFNDEVNSLFDPNKRLN